MVLGEAPGRLVFACLAPHGWLLVPLVAGDDGARTGATRAALEEMGRRLAAARPETIVIVDPHGLQVEGTIALLDSDRVAGETGGPPPLGATAHSFAMRFEVDRELNAALATAARAMDLPIARVRNFLDFVPLPIDYGSMVPLWYLGAAMMPPPRLVVVCPAPGMSRAAHLGLGRALRAALAQTDRRVAVIASADMAHRHAAGSHFGHDPAAVECDAAIIAAIRANELGRLSTYDEAWIERAATEAVGPLLALHGLMAGRDLRAEVLSYEVPTYFGMLCATFTPTS